MTSPDTDSDCFDVSPTALAEGSRTSDLAVERGDRERGRPGLAALLRVQRVGADLPPGVQSRTRGEPFTPPVIATAYDGLLAEAEGCPRDDHDHTWSAHLRSARCRLQGGTGWSQIQCIRPPTQEFPAVGDRRGPDVGFHLDDMALALCNLILDVVYEEAADGGRTPVRMRGSAAG